MSNLYPDPLPPGTDIITFVPDPNLSWVAVYAVACEDPECKVGHKNMLMIPIIGWIRVNVLKPTSQLVMRPALMLGNGLIVDYMSMSNTFEFVAVLKDNGEVGRCAREIYAKVHGEDEASKIVLAHETHGSN